MGVAPDDPRADGAAHTSTLDPDDGVEEARADEHVAPHRAVARRRWGRMAAEALLPIASSLAVLGVLLRPWGTRLRSPFAYSGDVFHVAMLIRAMEHGWDYRTNPLVGAPYGASNYDFPVGGDRLHLLALKVLARWIDDPLLVVNAYYLLTFVLIAVSAYVVLRVLGFGRLASTAGCVLFTFTPYHFAHGPSHLFLSAYFSVPLLLLLVVWASQGPWTRSLRPSRTALAAALRRPRTWGLLACAVIGGSASSYYAIFGVLLVVAVGATWAVRHRSWRWLVRPALAAAGVSVVAVTCLAPEILWTATHGDNPQAAERSAIEAETYGLHLATVVLPSPQHRVDRLAELGHEAYASPAPGELGAYIGAAAVVGLVFLLIVVLRTDRRADGAVLRRRTVAAATATWAVVLSTVGGLSMVLAVLGFTQIRAWARISIALVFLGLVGALDLAAVVRARLRWRSVPSTAAAIVLVTVGVLDQTPDLSGFGTAIERNAAARAEDDRFVATLDAALPAGAMVFQLPVTPYPEAGPVQAMTDYDHFRMPIADEGGLRWSYGGIRGRDTDWQARWAGAPLPTFVAGIAAVGFDALYVDRFGYGDRGAAFEAELRPLVGAPVSESGSGRLAWYDLRPLQETLTAAWGREQVAALGAAVARRISLWDLSEVPYDGRFASGEQLAVRNEGTTTVEVRLSFTVRTTNDAAVRIAAPGMGTIERRPSDGPVSLVFLARPGDNDVTLTSGAPPLGGDPEVVLALDGLALEDVQLAQMLATLDVPALLGGGAKRRGG